MSIRKKVLSLIAIFIIILSLNSKVFAFENKLDSIDITVNLDENGNATIQEKWTLYFPNGSESYKVLGNLEKEKLTRFRVSTEDYGNFQGITPWDIESSRMEKMYRNGIIKKADGSYELCWGIGDAEDLKTYTIEYDIENFIYKYADGVTGFNWEFISDGMNPAPTDVKITIKRAGGFNDKETFLWTFGIDSIAKVINGDIVAVSSYYTAENNLILIMETPESYFNVSEVDTKTLEEVIEREVKVQEYKDSLIVKTEEEQENLLESRELSKKLYSFFFKVILVIFLISLASSLFDNIVLKKLTINNDNNDFESNNDVLLRTSDFEDIETDISKEIPFENNISVILYILNQLSRDNNLYNNVLFAYILSWLKKGYLILDTKHKETTFSFASSTINGTQNERELFTLLKELRGKNNKVNVRVFKEWAKAHYEEIQEIIDNLQEEGKEEFENKTYSNVEEEINRLKGVYIYITEYSLNNKKELTDIEKWGDYLILAYLFNITDIVENEIITAYEKLNRTDEEEILDNIDMQYYQLAELIKLAYLRGVSIEEDGNEDGEDIDTYSNSTQRNYYYYHFHRPYTSNSSSSNNSSSGGFGGGFSGGSHGGGFGGGNR